MQNLCSDWAGTLSRTVSLFTQDTEDGDAQLFTRTFADLLSASKGKGISVLPILQTEETDAINETRFGLLICLAKALLVSNMEAPCNFPSLRTRGFCL